jgi:hypothetical protein
LQIYNSIVEIWGSVSAGCPAAHFYGFRKGGLETVSKPWLSYFNDYVKGHENQLQIHEHRLLGLHHIRLAIFQYYQGCLEALEQLVDLWKENSSTPLSRGPDVSNRDRLIHQLSTNSLEFCNAIRGDGRNLFTDGNGSVLDHEEYENVMNSCRRLKREIEADLLQAIQMVWARAILDYENECLNESPRQISSDPRNLGDWMEQFNQAALSFKSLLDDIYESALIGFERIVLLDLSHETDSGNIANLSQDPLVNQIITEDKSLNSCAMNYASVMEPIALNLRHHMVYSQYLTLICTAFRQKFLVEWSKFKYALALKDDPNLRYGITGLVSWLWQSLRLGWLVGIETLLSWSGDEAGMIQDIIHIVMGKSRPLEIHFIPDESNLKDYEKSLLDLFHETKGKLS